MGRDDLARVSQFTSDLYKISQVYSKLLSKAALLQLTDDEYNVYLLLDSIYYILDILNETQKSEINTSYVLDRLDLLSITIKDATKYFSNKLEEGTNND